MAQRVIEVILLGVDRQRFSWISEKRRPTEMERQAAVIATAALLAQRSVMTGRAKQGRARERDKRLGSSQQACPK